MVSFIACSTPHHFISPVASILGLGTNSNISPRLMLISVKKDRFFGYKELKGTRRRSGSSSEGNLNSEAEFGLEKEILMFMKNSKNPNEFPSKKELLEAGRVDLVNAITKTGGWLVLGWDSSDEEEEHFDHVRELQTRVDSFQQVNDAFTSSHHSASSSGRSLEIEADEDAGIEGILSRLKKHRSLSFDVRMEKNTLGSYASSNDNGGLTDFHKSTYAAGKINYGKEESQDNTISIHQIEERNREINPDLIRSRLQHMQLELSAALHSLRSKSQTLDSQVHKSSSSELQQLSDAWEFQENEVMKAEDKMRSIRAKLAVFEGKIALSVIDTQKLVEEKQRRIESARRTLQLLCTTCIFWTHSGSEVFLVGSFDGWTSQIKMEKTRTGIFSASLKLYPGRYEIKFIVDGIWRVDPMLPIVHNNGYENNCLIVHHRSA